MIYDIGDAPTVIATFKDVDGTLTDPTTVTATHRDPAGTESAITPTNDSAGVYSAVVPTVTLAGTHTVKVYGTGALVAAAETSFRVRDTSIGT
jgi:hypothetical protein